MPPLVAEDTDVGFVITSAPGATTYNVQLYAVLPEAAIRSLSIMAAADRKRRPLYQLDRWTKLLLYD